MARKQTDSLGLTIVAAILATRPEFEPRTEAELAAAAHSLWKACQTELGPGAAGEVITERVGRLLQRKSRKPVSFETVLRAVIGGEKRARRKKILNEYLCATIRLSIRPPAKWRPMRLDGVFEPFSPSEDQIAAKVEQEQKQMQKPGYFDAARILDFATSFQQWKIAQDKISNHNRAVAGGVASAEKRANASSQD